MRAIPGSAAAKPANDARNSGTCVSDAVHDQQQRRTARARSAPIVCARRRTGASRREHLVDRQFGPERRLVIARRASSM